MATHPLLIGDLFRRNARDVPGRPAASLGDRVLTHGELNAAGNRLAWALRDLGVGHGDRVVSWADTSLDVLPLFVALAKLGAVFAPLNARLGAEEAADVASLARAKLLVVDPARAADAAPMAKAASIDRVAFYPGAADVDGPVLDPARFENAREPKEPALAETDPHVVFFTSGSTGRPKGVVLSHRANHLRSFQGVFHDTPEKTVCMFPLFHMAAFTLALTAWQTRGDIAFVEHASAEAILDLLRQELDTTYPRLRFCGVILLIFVAVPFLAAEHTATRERAAAQTKLVRQSSAHLEISTTTCSTSSPIAASEIPSYTYGSSKPRRLPQRW